ncbi:MAG: polysaccharide biosynthesis C-terminal domain-containing protein [Ktedonobacteraceae bacterium]|nr:polysaccharide biosynthesis C-terminal domain-containing protein [Ktedonobacteraceae bacterium]
MFFAVRKQSISRITRSGLFQISPALGTTLIGIGSYIVTARALGPAAFGAFIFVQWLATITVPLIGVGMSALTSRQIVEIQSREPQPTIAGIFYYLWYRQCRRILLYCVVFFFLAFLLSWLFSVCTLLRLLLTGLAALPLFLSSIVGITLRSLRRLDLLGTLHLFGMLATLFLMVAATQVGGDQVEIFLLAVALAATLTLIMAVITMARLLPMKEAQPPGSYLREQLKRSFKPPLLHFILDAITWQRSESLLLALWRSPSELAFYAISFMISTTVMQLAPMLLSGWFLPLFLRHTHNRHYLNPYDAFIKTSCYMAFVAVAFCIAITTLGPYLIIYSIGPAYLPVLEPLRILLIAGVFGSIATVSLTHLANHGQNTTVLGIVAAVVNVGLAIPLVAYWGMTGAAMASTVAQVISASGSILLCRKILKRAEQKEAVL